MIRPFPAVFDCNVYLQAILNSRGAAGACWHRAIGGQIDLFVSEFALSEIRRLPTHPKLKRFRHLTVERVERFIEDLLHLATLAPPPPVVFTYPRDPEDAHYVNLAISTGSMLIVTNDRDLLDLMNLENAAGQALRNNYPLLRLITPPTLLASIEQQEKSGI